MAGEQKDLTLEKMAINSRLEKVELAINTLVTENRLNRDNDKLVLETMQKNIESLNHVVNGNGKVGLAEKVRGMESIVRNIKWMWVAIIGFIATTIRDWWIYKH